MKFRFSTLASLLLVASPLFLAPAHASDPKGSFVLRGAGSQVCPAFMTTINSRDQAASTTYLAWLQGYVSAHNRLLQDTFDVVPTANPADFMGVVKAICEKAPQFTVENAASQAIALLRPVRQNAASPMLKISHKGKETQIQAAVLLQLETRLIALGHMRGTASGKATPDLHAAIEKFQRAEKLPVTGHPDLTTLLRAQIAMAEK